MDKVKKTSWTKRYFLIEEIAHDLKDIAVKRGKSIYIHDKWISFKGKVSKRKQVQMEKMSDFDKSCCVSTAVEKFRHSKASYGLFFGHIMEKKYTDNHGKYHATVLILESIGTNRRAYFFNPYKLKSDSLPVLVGKIVRSWSRTITHVTCITGRQYHGTVTCVIHATQFAKHFVHNPCRTIELCKKYTYEKSVKY